MEDFTVVTVGDVINTQWAMTPYEEYSFQITGSEESPEIRIIETGNPENVHFHGYAKMVTSTEIADLYMTFGFGELAEVAVAWYGICGSDERCEGKVICEFGREDKNILKCICFCIWLMWQYRKKCCK